MMLLGVLFHASCSYSTLRIPAWPYRDPSTSPLLNAPLLLIHVFRMPIFFAMAGFFARLSWRRSGEARGHTACFNMRADRSGSVVYG
jgi:glucan biosynthesis protein C